VSELVRDRIGKRNATDQAAPKRQFPCLLVPLVVCKGRRVSESLVSISRTPPSNFGTSSVTHTRTPPVLSLSTETFSPLPNLPTFPPPGDNIF